MKDYTMSMWRLSDGEEKKVRLPIVGYEKAPDGSEVPCIGIKMMSDEDWNRSAIKDAVERYIAEFGQAPDKEETAVIWQRRRVEEMIRGLGCEN